jgi:8-oxo-dGTP pyrophosphatase MutT (NUDIX family)
MKTLWSGNHFKVVSPGPDEWEAVHESDMVLALPLVDGEYIIRKEYCPSYEVKNGDYDRFWTPISGTVENGEHPLETLKREMGEETPIKPERIRLFEQRKQVPFVKLSTQRVSFYHFEVLDYTPTAAEGDGSEVESQSTHGFVSPKELQDLSTRPNADFLISFMAKCAAERQGSD